ncbi:sulfotransferase family protein [Tunicatimonas pelagia]|uniref:sulfotransferase family protein n=1 Tax=Tunicatimonas pelagia TaxID=931531 RepID=UPI0026651035|nr:sulfotransferase [Tunicatimonas pelagia]WKN41969.1 sulfotransferase [Tunicatimonas pelagia]
MNTFKGPIFIVGMPRSGTKLLRTLLNQHSKISISSVETHFIPYLYEKFDHQCPEYPQGMKAFYDELAKTPFFRDTKRRGKFLDKATWLAAASEFSGWADLFEFLLRFYGSKPSMNTVFGDKTPSYVTKMRILKQEIFPHAKFIHIIRDPRDCCLSAKKLWGKNPLLFADVWHQSVKQARTDAALFADSYLEIQYEALLDQPEKILRQICQFVGISYQAAMMTLNKSAENHGDAKNAKQIVGSNKKKYQAELSQAVIKRIEEITFPSATKSGYSLDYAEQHRALSSINKNLLALISGYNAFRFHIREKGIRSGISYYLRLHQVTH